MFVVCDADAESTGTHVPRAEHRQRVQHEPNNSQTMAGQMIRYQPLSVCHIYFQRDRALHLPQPPILSHSCCPVIILVLQLTICAGGHHNMPPAS